MSRYATFEAAVVDVDLDELARRSGVDVDVIRAALDDHELGLAEQMRLGRALWMNPLELFAHADDIEAAMPEPRWVADAAALRRLPR